MASENLSLWFSGQYAIRGPLGVNLHGSGEVFGREGLVALCLESVGHDGLIGVMNGYVLGGDPKIETEEESARRSKLCERCGWEVHTRLLCREYMEMNGCDGQARRMSRKFGARTTLMPG